MQNKFKSLIVYTMTSGLGDYLIMGSLMKSVEDISPDVKCLMVHRANPHTKLWPYDNAPSRFFNIYDLRECLSLVKTLKTAKDSGYKIFGLQMAPGSVQGYFLHSFLKKLRALDYVVDFNLINADIITPVHGNYILDLHLNQISELLKIPIPKQHVQLSLPVEYHRETDSSSNSQTPRKRIGIHPWSRRGHLPNFVWPFERWAQLINKLLRKEGIEIVILGKDKGFDKFKNYLKDQFPQASSQLHFSPSNSVAELVGMVQSLDTLISVNTSVIHIGYALKKRMIILCGPSLDIWIPKGENIEIIQDDQAQFQGSDKYHSDPEFSSLQNIHFEKIQPFLEKI